MSQIAPASIREALPPFSGDYGPDDAAPDLIIRSGDGFDLHVHKAILCLNFVSVFFQNILDDAGDPPELYRDGKPVVSFLEPCTVLRRLLCLAYPGYSVEHYSLAAQNLDGACAVHAAADKYLFKGALALLDQMFENPALLEAHPHRIFAIARLRDLPALARKAALASLKFPVSPSDLVFPELDHLPAATFQKLHEFHHTCGKAAYHFVKVNSDCKSVMDATTSYITHAQDGLYEFVWWKLGGKA